MAAEDGLEENPKVKALAKLLRERRRDAFWYVMMWRRLVVHQGNAAGALPRNFTPDDVAAFLDFPGDARRLIRAMKATGFIGYRKGRGLFYPSWKITTTGSYVSKRDDDRVRKLRDREERRRQNAGDVPGPSADVHGRSEDASADGPRTVHGRSDIKKESKGREAPPPTAPPAGGALADARWAEIMKVAPTPQNREVCKRLIGALSAEDWALVQLAYGRLRDPTTLSKKNRRVLHWPTDMFIRKQAYLRFRPIARQSVTQQPRDGEPASVAAGLAELEQRLVSSDAFVVATLADPDVSAEAKSRARERWQADPSNAGRHPPWVKVPLPVTGKT